MSIIDELAVQIEEPAMREEFKRFARTGEATDQFLSYLDGNPKAQDAVEKAFDAQAAALGRLGKAIKDNTLGEMDFAPADSAAQMANFVDQVADIPQKERHVVLAHVVSNVTQKSGVAGARRAQEALTELQHALSSAIER
jgi:hypothetical protein